MSLVSFTLTFELVVDTATRQGRIRCTLVAPPETVEPGWEWPPELPKFIGIGTTMEDAIRDAFTNYRAARG